MASGVVTVGSRRYAVGLYWENSPGSGRVAQIAREAANQTGQQASFYAVRPGNKNGRIPQFGLSGAAAGAVGMPVLAGCLAGQIPGSWAGAFRLNEGIVVIIVRDDLIVPDGDLFFTDEAEARDRLIQEIGFGGLQNTYAPESWSITGADTIPLTLLLNDRKDIKLHAVQISQKLKLIILGVIVGFVVIVGAVWWWQQKIADDAAAQAAQEESLRRLQQNASNVIPGIGAPPAPEPKYERVWEERPPAMAIVHACNEGLSQLPVASAGWKMSELKCDGASISFSWSRMGGGAAASPPGAKLNDTGTGATQSVSLPHLENRGPEALIDPDVITNRYLLQNWPGSIAQMPPDPPPPPPPDYKGAWNPPPAPWVKRSFTLTVSELELSGMIGDLPGVIITSMSLSPDNLTTPWNIQGVIYENRK